MKLKKLEMQPCRGRRRGYPAMSFSKAGAITINKEALELVKVKPGDFLNFYQDQEDKINWYVSINKKEGIRARYDKLKNILCNSTQVRSALKKSLSIAQESFVLKIGEPEIIDGEKYYPLLYARPVYKPNPIDQI